MNGSELHAIRVLPAERVIDRAPSKAVGARLNTVDCFLAVNVSLAIFVWVFANHDRYYRLVADGRGLVFLAYAALLLGIIGMLWAVARRFTFQTRTLAVAEIVMLMHFAGGFLTIDGIRLYGHSILGMRFDKWVHIGAAFAVAALLMDLAVVYALPGKGIVRVLVMLAAIGVGAGVEMYEFLVTMTMPSLSVARFEDSLRDLLADFAGAALWLVTGWVACRRKRLEDAS